MNTRPPRLADRLIWLCLFSVMTMALVADQARANLHPEARAAGSFGGAIIDDGLQPEAWCCMQLEMLHRDVVSELDDAATESAVAEDLVRRSVATAPSRAARYADASPWIPAGIPWPGC